MARLPSGRFLMQQLGDDVVIFEEDIEKEIVRYPAADRDATASAQLTINSLELSSEDKAFAHFWSGYFYARATIVEG